MKRTMLVVGHEPAMLKDTPGFLDTLGLDWEVQSAATPQEAFDALRLSPVAAVLADLRLPGQSGTQFLDTVMQDFPAVHRFMLADLTDRETMLKCVATAHQFIAKPCDGRVLLNALDRSFKIELLFGNELVKRHLARIKRMPSPPASYFQIVKELQSPGASMDSIGTIIGHDQAVTVKLLQMVNSATFGLQRRVSSPAEAVLFLGIETTKSLVLLAHTFSYFDKVSIGGFSVEALWGHSLAAARLARSIARAEEVMTEMREEAFTAGLLHDLGKLLLAANEPEEFKRVTAVAHERKLAAWEAEQEIFSTTHAELGAWLVAIWGLPLAIVEAIALHHHPARFLTDRFCPLTAVHAANFISHEQRDHDSASGRPQIDMRYLADLGLQERLAVWRQIGRALGQQGNS